MCAWAEAHHVRQEGLQGRSFAHQDDFHQCQHYVPCRPEKNGHQGGERRHAGVDWFAPAMLYVICNTNEAYVR